MHNFYIGLLLQQDDEDNYSLEGSPRNDNDSEFESSQPNRNQNNNSNSGQLLK
jgi:hypothetical protein